MARFFISVLFVVTVTNFAAAQQKGFFRYTADPFEESESVAATESSDDATSSEASTRSFSSYETQEEISPVHRRAMLKAQQRQLLLASRQWHGHSALRPTVYANPHMTSYRPISPVVPLTVMQVQRPYRIWNGPYYDWY